MILAYIALWGGYFVWRAACDPTSWRRWGMLQPGVGWGPYAAFTAVGLVGVAAFAVAWPRPLPHLSWWSLALYPPWALAQQFALQNLFAADLRTLGVRGWAVALVAGACLGLGHFPHAAMGVVAAAGGVAWTAMWPRWPNLWAIAASHAVLGAAALVFVVGVNPAGDFYDVIPRS